MHHNVEYIMCYLVWKDLSKTKLTDFICNSTCVCVCVCVSVKEREERKRDRERHRDEKHIYTNKHVCTHTAHKIAERQTDTRSGIHVGIRRRDNTRRQNSRKRKIKKKEKKIEDEEENKEGEVLGVAPLGVLLPPICGGHYIVALKRLRGANSNRQHFDQVERSPRGPCLLHLEIAWGPSPPWHQWPV